MERGIAEFGIVGALFIGLSCGGTGDGGEVGMSGTGTSTSTSTTGTVSNDTVPDSTAGSDSQGTTVGSTTGEASDDSGIVDLPDPDVGVPPVEVGGCGCASPYIWVTNSEQSTVSKINTVTLVEEGRYLTRPDGDGNPSRTSVNLAGDVAVANRHGGLVKFYADVADCQESNGMPGIQTSTGAGDVLPWDQEECRGWYTDFPITNQRPVAWTGGSATRGDCNADDAEVWTVMSTIPGFPGLGGSGGLTAAVVDGNTGAIVEQVDIPQEVFDGSNFGAYGGAVDAQGDLYFIGLGGFSTNVMARVRRADLVVETWPLPDRVHPYGITVDHAGNPWVSTAFGVGGARFDPSAETWDVIMGFSGDGGGLAEGPDDRMYISGEGGIYAVDLENLAVDHVFVSSELIKGVSFDSDSFLWAVTFQDADMPTPQGGVAFKVDPDTGVVDDQYDGLDFPYTYSDMTGQTLNTVHCPRMD